MPHPRETFLWTYVSFHLVQIKNVFRALLGSEAHLQVIEMFDEDISQRILGAVIPELRLHLEVFDERRLLALYPLQHTHQLVDETQLQGSLLLYQFIFEPLQCKNQNFIHSKIKFLHTDKTTNFQHFRALLHSLHTIQGDPKVLRCQHSASPVRLLNEQKQT